MAALSRLGSDFLPRRGTFVRKLPMCCAVFFVECLLCSAPTLAEVEHEFIGTASVVVRGGNVAVARAQAVRQAKHDALKHAVRSAAGNSHVGEQLLHIHREVLRSSEQLIQSYRVIKETNEAGRFEIELSVIFDRMRVRSAVARISGVASSNEDQTVFRTKVVGNLAAFISDDLDRWASRSGVAIVTQLSTGKRQKKAERQPNSRNLSINAIGRELPPVTGLGWSVYELTLSYRLSRDDSDGMSLSNRVTVVRAASTARDARQACLGRVSDLVSELLRPLSRRSSKMSDRVDADRDLFVELTGRIRLEDIYSLCEDLTSRGLRTTRCALSRIDAKGVAVRISGVKSNELFGALDQRTIAGFHLQAENVSDKVGRYALVRDEPVDSTR